MSITKTQNIIGKQKMQKKAALPTLKPSNKPPLTAAEIKWLKASITNTNNRVDRASPFLNPRELLKKLLGEPLTNTENRTEEIQ